MILDFVLVPARKNSLRTKEKVLVPVLVLVFDINVLVSLTDARYGPCGQSGSLGGANRSGLGAGCTDSSSRRSRSQRGVLRRQRLLRSGRAGALYV